MVRQVAEMGVCPACGAKALSRVRGNLDVPFRKSFVTIEDIEYSECGACGEQPMSMAEFDELQQLAVAAERKRLGLLTPEQIRTIRNDLGWTQRQFEIALGVGEKTVIRWEKGTVFQGAGVDTLMRLFADDSVLANTLLSKRMASAALISRATISVRIGNVRDSFIAASRCADWTSESVPYRKVSREYSAAA